MVEPNSSGSFVARIWLEGKKGSHPTWRGHIQHVQGEEEEYFQCLSEMRAFVERISGVSMPMDKRTELKLIKDTKLDG